MNSSIPYHLKFLSYITMNLGEVHKQRVWQAMTSLSIVLNLQEEVNKRKGVSQYHFE